MKITLVLILIAIDLFASKIVSHRVYEKDSRVDIMLTFDSEYKGKISQKKEKNRVVLILQDAILEKNVNKKIVSPLIQNMELLSFADGTIVKLKGDENFVVQASKTVDNYGLRLRITPSMQVDDSSQLNEDLIVDEDEDIALSGKKEDQVSNAYLKVILTLIMLGLFLYLLKRWVENRGGLKESWLFQKDSAKLNKKSKNNSIKIISQRPLDHKNRIVVISYEDKEYLLLMGDSNVLLDSFAKDQTKSSIFDSHLKQNEEALKEFITNHNDDKLTNYKQKASFGG